MKANEKSKILRVRGKLELEKHMFYYNCQTKEELEELLLEQYNTILITN